MAWESLISFYYRGRHGPPEPPSPRAAAPSPPAREVAREVARWRTGTTGGWAAGRLTGDYNPLHWWPGHARRRGYRGAFPHPLLALAACLSHPPPPVAGPGLRLDAWLKGPVYQGAEVVLRAEVVGGATTFALEVEGDARPAVVGRWAPAAAGEAP